MSSLLNPAEIDDLEVRPTNLTCKVVEQPYKSTSDTFKMENILSQNHKRILNTDFLAGTSKPRCNKAVMLQGRQSVDGHQSGHRLPAHLVEPAASTSSCHGTVFIKAPNPGPYGRMDLAPESFFNRLGSSFCHIKEPSANLDRRETVDDRSLDLDQALTSARSHARDEVRTVLPSSSTDLEGRPKHHCLITSMLLTTCCFHSVVN